jgi:hypothetical protein
MENNIKKVLARNRMLVIDWIDMSENSDRCWALINAVMNKLTSIRCGEFLN